MKSVMEKGSLYLLTAIVAGLFVVSAGMTTPAQAADDDAYTITVIPKGTTHDFWQSVHAGAIKAQRELAKKKIAINIVWQGPLREDDRNSQIQVVQANVSKGVSAIVLAPLDSRSLRNPVRMANKRGVPVVIIDSDIERKGVELVSFVATDNYKGGTLAGEEMARILGGKGNVVMLRYAVGSASTEAREKGFVDAIAKHEGIKLISDNQYAGATAETAREKSGSLLTGLKGEKIDGIYCPNESSTFGMLRTLQERDLTGKITFVGFDSSPKLLEALDVGDINALVVQNPFKMGFEGVMAAYKALAGEKVKPRIDTGCVVVTKANQDNKKIAEIINPPLEKYLK